jgi:hypothetical protein
VIEQTPWARNNYLRLAAQRTDLILVRHTAVDRYALDPSSRSEGLDYVIDLLCQLTSWGKDKCLARAWGLRHRQAMQKRKNERSRLSSSSLRETD